MNPGARPEYFTSPKPLPIATHIEGWLFKHVVPFEVGTATVLERGGGTPAARPSVTPRAPSPPPLPRNCISASPAAALRAQVFLPPACPTRPLSAPLPLSG